MLPLDLQTHLNPSLLPLRPSPQQTHKKKTLPSTTKHLLPIVFNQISQKVFISAVPSSFIASLAVQGSPHPVPQAEHLLKQVTRGCCGGGAELSLLKRSQAMLSSGSFYLQICLWFLFNEVLCPRLSHYIFFFSRLLLNPGAALALHSPSQGSHPLSLLYPLPGRPDVSSPDLSPISIFNFL